jgi:hypothetical protein
MRNTNMYDTMAAIDPRRSRFVAIHPKRLIIREEYPDHSTPAPAGTSVSLTDRRTVMTKYVLDRSSPSKLHGLSSEDRSSADFWLLPLSLIAVRGRFLLIMRGAGMSMTLSQ